MLVFVHLDDRIETFFEGIAVCSESDDRKDDAGIVVIADAEELGDEARVDAVAGGGAGVAGEDGEVGAGDAEG